MSRVSAAVRGLLLASAALAFGWGAAPANAQSGLPDPYVSPALDAVLMPITPAVKTQFKLPRAATGIVVASVQPGGVGELYGFEPGEVITRVDGKLIRRPVDLDGIVGYGLDRGESLFFFDGLWKGRNQRTIAQIDDDSFRRPISFDTAPRWPGYRARGFDYVDWYRPYSGRAATIWEETLLYVSAIIITDLFIDAMTSDQAVFYYYDDSYYWPYDEYYITEVDSVFYETYSEEVYSVSYTEEVYESYYEETFVETYSEESYFEEVSEESYSDETVTEESYSEEGTEVSSEDASGEEVTEESFDATTEEAAPEEEVYEDPAAEESYGDPAAGEGYEEPVAEESYEEPAAEETYEEPVAEEAYEEPVAEEAYEEPVYDEPVVEESYEEPAYEEPVVEETYEEPAYEEPAYEEPVYEEPAGDEGGGDCGFDEDGLPLC